MDNSESIEPFQELVRTFNDFIQEAVRYINDYGMFGSSFNKSLYDLLLLWIHPQGVAKLIKSIIFEYSNDPTFPVAIKPQSLVPLSRWSVRGKIQEVFEPECTPEKQSKKKEKQLISEKKQLSEEIYYEQSNQGEDLEDVVKDEEYQSSFSQNQNKSYKRGPYKRYTYAEKFRAVYLYTVEKLPISEVSKRLGIPCKNIKRWAMEGLKRKNGGGRKRSQPELQSQVKNWLIGNFVPGEPITISQIQEFALSRIDGGQFKASRGWVMKFIERNKLRGLFTIV